MWLKPGKGDSLVMASELEDVLYVCSVCGAQQVVTYFKSETPQHVLCCVECRAGFGIANPELMKKMNQGMFPTVYSDSNLKETVNA